MPTGHAHRVQQPIRSRCAADWHPAGETLDRDRARRMLWAGLGTWNPDTPPPGWSPGADPRRWSFGRATLPGAGDGGRGTVRRGRGRGPADPRRPPHPRPQSPEPAHLPLGSQSPPPFPTLHPGPPPSGTPDPGERWRWGPGGTTWVGWQDPRDPGLSGICIPAPGFRGPRQRRQGLWDLEGAGNTFP